MLQTEDIPMMTCDVAVFGSGVFGAWVALWLRRAGASVVLLDPYGPGNSRSSSGESPSSAWERTR
ncbi:MAG: FAD-dependent oxidoreductase [Bryobacterales bacterium]|nr:FAD-dependent oxidoreductase [Bryobacterales bacterium]